MAIELKLTKPGDSVKKLQLPLSKAGGIFNIEFFWDSKHDLDGHALLLSGGKLQGLGGVLSTYNPSLPLGDGSASSREPGDKRPFKTPDGALLHHGDARTGGSADVDEMITVNTGSVPANIDEIALIVTLHPAGVGNFREVKDAGFKIKDGDNRVLAEVNLSNDFGPYNVVQCGSLLRGDQGWEYLVAGVGVKGDFNTVLDYFS